jgi:hypothetical protein
LVLLIGPSGSICTREARGRAGLPRYEAASLGFKTAERELKRKRERTAKKICGLVKPVFNYDSEAQQDV